MPKSPVEAIDVRGIAGVLSDEGVIVLSRIAAPADMCGKFSLSVLVTVLRQEKAFVFERLLP